MEFRFHVIVLIYPLACAELAFDLISITNCPGHRPLSSGLGHSLGGRRSVPDTIVYHKAPFGLVHLDFIGVYVGVITILSNFCHYKDVKLDLRLQICTNVCTKLLLYFGKKKNEYEILFVTL